MHVGLHGSERELGHAGYWMAVIWTEGGGSWCLVVFMLRRFVRHEAPESVCTYVSEERNRPVNETIIAPCVNWGFLHFINSGFHSIFPPQWAQSVWLDECRVVTSNLNTDSIHCHWTEDVQMQQTSLQLTELMQNEPRFTKRAKPIHTKKE